MTRRDHSPRREALEGDFRCLHCHYQVSASALRAGVQNRNHCPYCLWSRHVDWKKAGDRLATCMAEMQPIGLTLKATRKKYGPARAGELMLIHQCLGCGKLSINRIAADDNSSKLMEIFRGSFELDLQVKEQLAASNIALLLPEDKQIVTNQLFGKGDNILL